MGFPNKEQSDAIVAAYRDDDVATVATVASEHEVSEATVLMCLKRAKMPLRDGDAELAGIPPSAPAVDTASPAFKEAVASTVAEVLANMGAPQASAAPSDWAEFMQSMKQLAQSLNDQKPGYNKPLSPEEMAEREEGRKAFFRLIEAAKDAVEEMGPKGARERGLLPEYIVGPGGIYAMTESGEQLFSPGQRAFLTIPPPIDFEPLNEAAEAIMLAQKQWLGQERPDVGEMVAAAQIRAMGRDPAEASDRRTNRRSRDVFDLDADAPVVDVGPRRIMGAMVQDSGNDGHTQFRITKGLVGRPVTGPVFVDS